MDHSFVVPAYGSSPYLEKCLESLRTQSLGGSEIVLSSSTPSDGLQRLAERFGVPLRVHAPNAGIGRDWNAALDCATRGWVTIAHQDDVYLPHFVACTMDAATRTDNAAMVITGYAELLNDRVRQRTLMLKIKSLLLELGFLGRPAVSSRRAKLRMLKLGCPVACPSVTMGPTLAHLRFREDLKVDLDWEAWIRAARVPGAFCYVREPLMLHRIHPASETSSAVRNGVRAAEDLQMFSALWPAPVAALISRLYSLSYEEGR